MTRKRGAEVIFVERTYTGYGLPGWDVRLVNARDARDRQHGDQPVGRGFYAAITYTMPYGSIQGYGEDTPEGERSRYRYVTQGWHAGGRRYGAARTLAGAQRAVAAWARRRFWIEED